ncbi:MAG: hypothetical protein EBU49_01330 [Proteobacteria bacterium]|nr:hypothetical protein [Pseudomonadota bacterium]
MMPFPGFPGEIRILVCDFNSDGYQDVIFAAGPGGGPHVKVYSRNSDGSTVEIFSSFTMNSSDRSGVLLNGCGNNRVLVTDGSGNHWIP